MKKFNSILDNLYMFTARPSSIQRETFYGGYFANNAYSSIENILTMPISETDVEWYYDKSTAENFFAKQAEEFFKPNFLEIYKKRNEQYFNTFLAVCKEINNCFQNKNFKKKDATGFVRKLYKYSFREDCYFYFAMSIWSFEQKVLPVIEKRVKKYYKEKFEKNWHYITLPTELSQEQKFRIELAKIKQKYGEKVPSNIISRIHQKYRYLGIYSPEDYGLTIEYVLKNYHELETKHTLDIIEKIKENKARVTDFLENCDDDEIKNYIELVNYNINIRNLRSEKLSFGFALITPFYDFLTKNLDFTRKQIGNLTRDEVSDYFEKNKIPPKRDRHPGMFYYRKNSRTLTPDEIKLFNHKFNKQKLVESFKGKVANKGFARGKVKIILSTNDLADFEDGNILVSQFTRPEYFIAIKKSKAVITNDGGITSHAAIVSRELNKPCVIGTRIATKVLKNGDVVEVDANIGIIKIIK